MNDYRDNCIRVFKQFFPFLTQEEVEAVVDMELNSECRIHKLFPKIKIESVLVPKDGSPCTTRL